MFDLHVHAAPDIVERKFDDAHVVSLFREAGFEGCVLKSHNEPTGGRAAVMRTLTGFPVFGSIVLNRVVGGFNPAAVAAELDLGARVVWMPTEDAIIHRRAQLPRGLTGRHHLSDHDGYATPPLDESSASAVREILDLIADADAVLATGHLSGDECAWLLSEARHHGVTRMLLTHPAYTVPGLSPLRIRELADFGAKVEITAYQLLLQPGMTSSHLAEVARCAGDQLVLSSDAGTPSLPFPPEALAHLIEVLANEGVDRGVLSAAASSIPRDLVVV
jgi:hypothetical protein